MVNKEDERYFAYLDQLRESGVVNMFGAAPYLATDFDLSSPEARAILVRWMNTYGERHPHPEQE